MFDSFKIKKKLKLKRRATKNEIQLEKEDRRSRLKKYF